ncbi:hypothetical protein BGX31_004054 [Mortierella sp. GBA43]|nr:hypothetical protein BGX31_004054 [Mortierella sp. GBA43]
MSRIKALILPRSMFTSRTLCTLLKDHLPNIERFHFHDVDNNLGNDLIASFQDAVEQGCRNLQHVNFTCSHSNRNVEEVIKGVVSGCKEWGLRSFCGVEYGERKHKNRNSLMKRLLDYHANTLEIVELESYKVIASHDLVRLFHECKNLRRAKIVPDRIDYRRALYYDDIVSKEWVCRDLEELHILLARRRCDSEEEDDSDDKAPMQLLKRVFEQIGRSTKLEVLCLAASVFGNMGLNLEHGGLSHLVGLKKLRHLGMTEELWLEVGQAEVEFMDSQWPQLESVSFRSTHMSGVATKPHWQWLQERRPTLNYFESVR